MTRRKVGATRVPEDGALFRGDAHEGVAVPDPRADPSVVRHILYLDGAGRATPYSSTTDDPLIARSFARPGRVWRTSAARARLYGAELVDLEELLQNLRGSGRGDRFRGRPAEVAQARVYAERHHEHLLDWRAIAASEARARVTATFE